MNNFSYNKLILEIQKVIREATVPKHWSKTKNETFNVHTICVLFVLFQLENKDYRMFSAWVEIAPALGLKRVPHWTTIEKAFKRLPQRLIRKLLQLSGKCNDRTVSLDPTYYQLTNPSKGYCKRIRRDPRKDRLLKASVVVGIKSKLVSDVYVAAQERHGTRDVPNIVKSGCFKNKIVLGDKEFDSELFHQQVEDAGGRSIVPLRNRGKIPYYRIKGVHRKQLSKRPIPKVYRKRSNSEANNSAVKRKFGATLKGKTFWQQARSLYGKYFTYNLYRRVMASSYY